MIARRWIVAVGCVGLAACGHGGGDSSGRAATRLAVGSRVVDVEVDGERGSELRGLILRDDGDGWAPVGGDVVGDQELRDVLFASADVAWAYSYGRVFRSRDDGRTWQDVTAHLPAELREGSYAFSGLAFADATTGYLAAASLTPAFDVAGAPFVWITRDGGETWRAAEDLTPRPDQFGFAVAVRAGIPETLRPAFAGGGAAVVQGFDGADYGPQVLTTSPSIVGNGLDAVGARGFAAVIVTPSPDGADWRPAIFTSTQPGASWSAQAVPDVAMTDFAALDMCDAQVGVAAGNGLSASVALWTADGGAAWRSSTIAGATDDLVVVDALCVRADDMAILARDGTPEAPVSVLFASDDGGRTFARTDASFPDRARLFALASDAGLR